LHFREGAEFSDLTGPNQSLVTVSVVQPKAQRPPRSLVSVGCKLLLDTSFSAQGPGFSPVRDGVCTNSMRTSASPLLL
jgi:hypothetical protein